MQPPYTRPGVGWLLAIAALVLTILLIVTNQLEFKWLGAILLLIEGALLL